MCSVGVVTESRDVEVLACELPGCPNVLEYGGVGRKPKYCGLVVDGVVHSRLNAQKVRNGQLTLPAPGSRPAAGESPAPRPVSLAKAGIELLRDEIGQTLTHHQGVLGDLITRFEQAMATATDPDAAATEVAAVHRDARTRIDTAEAVADDALARARAAEAAQTAAQAAQAAAEQSAEQALADLDDAVDRATAAENARDENAARATNLAADLDARTAETTEQRRRAETAQRDLARADATAAISRGQLDDTRAQLQAMSARTDQLVADLSTAREQLAQTRGQLDGARTAIAEEKGHSTQRLADQRDAYEAQLLALRARTPDTSGGHEAAEPPAEPGPPAPRRTRRSGTTAQSSR